ncbi:MAG: type II secretion system protein GspG [Candidatus Aminicenantes bacterium]|nr:type II secretion system protein GspG [Candidatus Aminicenantes bacterium]
MIKAVMKIRGLLLVTLAAAAIVVGILSIKIGDKVPIKADVDRYLQVQIDLTRTNMQTLQNIIASFLATEGGSPADLQAVRSAGLLTTGAQDAWGRDIRYEKRSEASFRLTSMGRDGKLGTADDIVMDY